MLTTTVAPVSRPASMSAGTVAACGACGAALRPYAQIDARRLGEVFYTDELRRRVPALAYDHCPRCHSIWAADARRDPELLAQLYAALPDSYWTALAAPDACGARVEELLTAHAPGPVVCDVGCGDGGLLRALAPGWIKYGIEPGAAAVAACRRAGLDVRRGTPRDWPGLPAVDACTCIDTLEHMPDPAAELAALAGHLRPGGVLLLLTGDAGSTTARLAGGWWEYLHCVGHVAVLSRRALAAVLRRAGCTVIHSETVNHAAGVTRRTWLGRWLMNHWRCRRGRRYRPLPYSHDHQLVVARRSGGTDPSKE